MNTATLVSGALFLFAVLFALVGHLALKLNSHYISGGCWGAAIALAAYGVGAARFL